MNYLREFFDFLRSHAAEVMHQTFEHLWLTLVSLSLSVMVGIGLGILMVRYRRIAKPILAFVNAVQTVPSIALLGFLLPLLGIGTIPAITALFLYGLLPIVRNTYTGMLEVDPHTVEAAYGMGLTDRQVLSKVSLPLAMPVIFAGIRTAFVVNVGVATLCALIAAGGLGTFIFRGLTTNNSYMMLAGALPAALIALVFDVILSVLQRHIIRLFRPLLLGLFTLGLLLGSYYLFLPDGAPAFRAGFPSEFIERGDGYIGLRDAYGLELEVVEMEIGLMYQALKNEKVDVISGFSTDGRIGAYDLKVLEDDRRYFPPYHAAPLIRGQLLRQYPELKAVFEDLHNAISDEEMARLNYRVDHDGLDAKDAALEFLKGKGFATGQQREGKADIVIGSKNFTENFILAELFKAIIENGTTLTVELKLGFGGTKLIFDALNNGDIDLYPEYTGTGLLVILQPDAEQREDVAYSKTAVLEYVSENFKSRYDIVWLPEMGFNNTFALMMRRSQADSLGISSISDMNNYLIEQASQ